MVTATQGLSAVRVRARLETPDCGVCLDGGPGIPFERLRVPPAAQRCVRCQSLIERAHSVPGAGPKL